MKKILIIDFSEIIGGAEIYFYRLLKNLKRRFLFYAIFSPPVASTLKIKDLGKLYLLQSGQSLEKWRGLNLFSPYNLILYLRLNQIIKSLGKIDIIIFGGAKEVFLLPPICQKFKIKSVYIHHFSPLPFWLFYFPFKQIFIKKLSKTSKIFHVSQFMNRLFEKNFSLKGEVIKNGVNIKEFSPANFLEKQKIKKSLGLENKLVIGNVGRFHKLKGQQILLLALIPLFKKYPNLSTLLLSGDGKAKIGKIQNFCQKKEILNRVKILSFQKNISQYYKAMDIFVLPSLAENLPLTLLEAASSGLPCIASSVGGVPEILSKKEGILVPSSDIPSLSKALEKLILDSKLRKKLGQAARKKIVQKFDEQLTFNKVANSINHL